MTQRSGSNNVRIKSFISSLFGIYGSSILSIDFKNFNVVLE